MNPHRPQDELTAGCHLQKIKDNPGDLLLSKNWNGSEIILNSRIEKIHPAHDIGTVSNE
jgi:hypothetical protein